MTDAKVEAARIEVERSRAQLLDTAKLLQQRLQPGKLTRDVLPLIPGLFGQSR